MSTLATLYDRFLGRGAHADAQWTEARPARANDYRLRPFPNEDVHFHVKRIDNSRVIREADPQAPKVCWKMIGGASASAMLLIGLLLPSGYRLMAGYQIEELKKEHEKLLAVRDELELEEAKLLSPEHLAKLATFQEFVDPEPGRVIHLQEKSSVAMRHDVRPAAAVPVATPEAASAAPEQPAPGSEQ